jgi:hypothetical protein
MLLQQHPEMLLLLCRCQLLLPAWLCSALQATHASHLLQHAMEASGHHKAAAHLLNMQLLLNCIVNAASVRMFSHTQRTRRIVNHYNHVTQSRCCPGTAHSMCHEHVRHL